MIRSVIPTCGGDEGKEKTSVHGEHCFNSIVACPVKLFLEISKAYLTGVSRLDKK
jgi:hypothetical protein